MPKTAEVVIENTSPLDLNKAASPQVMPVAKRPRSVTLRDVAAHAGANLAAVSMVLNGARSNGGVSQATRERIMGAARELGYQVNPHAQRLSSGRCNNTIALFSLHLEPTSGMPKVQRIQQHLGNSGFDAVLHGYGNFNELQPVRQTALMADLRRFKPRAIVCDSAGLLPETLAEMYAYQDEGGLLVCFDQKVELNCDQVIFDREHNTYIAAKRLLEAGHRKLGLFIPGPQQPIGHDRALGFERALREYGGETRREWMAYGHAETGGAEFAQQWLKLPPQERPTGICVVNDHAALAFMFVVQQAGIRIPEDVAVVGHDDAPLGRYYSVPLTTVTNPLEEISNTVVSLLQDRLSDRYSGPPRRVVLRGELQERGSVAPIA